MRDTERLHPFEVEQRRRENEQTIEDLRDIIDRQERAIETLLDALEDAAGGPRDLSAVRDELPDSAPEARRGQDRGGGIQSPWEREGFENKREWLDARNTE